MREACAAHTEPLPCYLPWLNQCDSSQTKQCSPPSSASPGPENSGVPRHWYGRRWTEGCVGGGGGGWGLGPAAKLLWCAWSIWKKCILQRVSQSIGTPSVMHCVGIEREARERESARAGDRDVSWLACSIQSVMSAPTNVGHSVHAFLGLRLLSVSSRFFPRNEPGSALSAAPTAIKYDKLWVAARGKNISSSWVNYDICLLVSSPSPSSSSSSCCWCCHIDYILSDMWTGAELRVARGYFWVWHRHICYQPYRSGGKGRLHRLIFIACLRPVEIKAGCCRVSSDALSQGSTFRPRD